MRFSSFWKLDKFLLSAYAFMCFSAYSHFLSPFICWWTGHSHILAIRNSAAVNNEAKTLLEIIRWFPCGIWSWFLWSHVLIFEILIVSLTVFSHRVVGPQVIVTSCIYRANLYVPDACALVWDCKTSVVYLLKNLHLVRDTWLPYKDLGTAFQIHWKWCSCTEPMKSLLLVRIRASFWKESY